MNVSFTVAARATLTTSKPKKIVRNLVVRRHRGISVNSPQTLVHAGLLSQSGSSTRRQGSVKVLFTVAARATLTTLTPLPIARKLAVQSWSE